MLEGLGNIAEMMKLISRARAAAPRIGEELAKLATLVVEGSAGGGMVKVRVNGKQELLECKIDPQVFADHDVELLEDLVLAATNQALQRARSAFEEKMGEAAGGIDVAGLKDALSRLGGGAAES